MDSPSPVPRVPSPLPHAHHTNRDDIKGMDIIQATLKPTRWDHFKALVIHNMLITFRNPSVYIFGSAVPLLMIGIAIGIVSNKMILVRTGPFSSKDRARLISCQRKGFSLQQYILESHILSSFN